MEYRLLTISEAARILRISQSTLRRWIRLGLVPSRKLGRRRLLLASEIEKIIENGLNPAETRV